MLSKHSILHSTLRLILLGLVVAAPAMAGSAVVGSVAGSMNATVGGQTLLPNTTLFSGDSLQVNDGVAVVALGSASRLVFGRDTAASFLRDSNEVTVLLGQGNVSLFHDVDGTPVRMKIGEISVVPASGFKTLGEVATLNGTVVVTTKEGLLRVEGNGPVIDVAKGKTITVTPRTTAPQGGGKAPGGGVGRCCTGGASTALEVAAIGAGGVAAIMAGVALSRAGTASTNASAADSAAAAAASAAAAAASAAAAAASAAAAALSQAQAAAIAAGCALNAIDNQRGIASPYIPPAGVSCYNSSTW
jgi:hypothetical protein